MIKFVPLSPKDEVLILEWRNSPEVARYMYRDWEITQDEHHRWFTRALVDSRQGIHRLVLIDDRPSGISSLTAFDDINESCEWGGYLAPGVARGAGIGRKVLGLALQMAFYELGHKRMYVEVISTNLRALALYKSVGFEIVNSRPKPVARSGKPTDCLRLVMERDLFA